MPRAAKIAIVGVVFATVAWTGLRCDLERVLGFDGRCEPARNDRAIACAPARLGPRTAASVPADARGFVDTIGVNTHLWYLHTGYGNYAMVKRRLLELGIRHIRDGFDPAHTQAFHDRVNDLAAAGIKSTLIACRVEAGGERWTTYVKDAKQEVRSSLDALEGVNEPDLVAAGTDWSRFARACQRDVYRQARSKSLGAPLRVPVLGPSVQPGNMQALGDISDRADRGAIHPYPGGLPPSRPGEHSVASQMASARRYQFAGARVAVHATETGYNDALETTAPYAPASQRAVSLYVPRLFLEYARAGVERTFVYELVDERSDPALGDVEANFGLFESDWSPKPSALALRNTIALLDSPRRGPRRPLRYRLENTADPDGPGPRGAVEDMLLQKADGSYWLALWKRSKVWDERARTDIANPATAVRVMLDRSMTLTSYHPTYGIGASNRRTGRCYTAELGDDVLLLKMT